MTSSLDISIESIQPASGLERWSSSRLIMRYLRYRQYPKQVKGLTADVHHIADHGYAHLASTLGAGKKTITVHDLIPLLSFKGKISGHAASRRPLLNQYSLSHLHLFDAIVTPSQSTANDLIEWLDIPAEKITTIAPIIGAQFKPLPEEQVISFANRFGLSQGHQWVMISGQEFYKNHATSLQVVKQIRSQGVDLKVLKTGVATAEFTALVSRLGLDDHVHQIFLDDFADLPLVYNFVDCLLFPSLYEGFGMPVVEALACGTPVVASNSGALAEIKSSELQQVEAYSVSQIQSALLSKLGSPRGEKHTTSGSVAEYRADALVPKWAELFNRVQSA